MKSGPDLNLFSPGCRRTGARGCRVEETVSGGDGTLRTGDGAGSTAPTELNFSFQDHSEVFLIDVRMDVPRIWQ